MGYTKFTAFLYYTDNGLAVIVTTYACVRIDTFPVISTGALVYDS